MKKINNFVNSRFTNQAKTSSARISVSAQTGTRFLLSREKPEIHFKKAFTIRPENFNGYFKPQFNTDGSFYLLGKRHVSCYSRDGKLIWDKNIFKKNAVIDNYFFSSGRMHLIASQNNIIAIDKGGDKIWNYDLPTSKDSVHSMAADKTSNTYIIYCRGNNERVLLALDSHGRTRWESDLKNSGNFLSPINVDSQGNIYTCSYHCDDKKNSILHKFNSEGKKLWEQEIPGTLLAGESIAVTPDDKIALTYNRKDGDRGGYLIVLDSNGNCIWNERLGDVVTSPVLTKDGNLLIRYELRDGNIRQWLQFGNQLCCAVFDPENQNKVGEVKIKGHKDDLFSLGKFDRDSRGNIYFASKKLKDGKAEIDVYSLKGEFLKKLEIEEEKGTGNFSIFISPVNMLFVQDEANKLTAFETSATKEEMLKQGMLNEKEPPLHSIGIKKQGDSVIIGSIIIPVSKKYK